MTNKLPPNELRYQYRIAKLHVARQLGLTALPDKYLAQLINLNRDPSMLSHVLHRPTKSQHVYNRIVEFIHHSGVGKIPVKTINEMKDSGLIDAQGRVVAAKNWPLSKKIMEAAQV